MSTQPTNNPLTYEFVRQKYIEVFDRFDKNNGDEIIEREEFADAYMNISGFTSAAEFESPLTEIEFFDSVSAQFPLLFMDSTGTPLTYNFVREQYAKAFDRFDTNRDGIFQKEELEKISIEF